MIRVVEEVALNAPGFVVHLAILGARIDVGLKTAKVQRLAWLFFTSSAVAMNQESPFL